MRRILPAALAATLALAAPAAVAAEIGAERLERLRAEALRLVNESREAEGLAPLEARESLEEAAASHARDMLEKDYMAHVAPDGTTPRERFLAAGGSPWQAVAENVTRCEGCETPPGEGRVAQFHAGFMDSAGHRANILTPGLTGFGYGIAAADGAATAVQMFAGPGVQEGAEPGETASVPAVRGALLREVNAAREGTGAPPLETSEALSAAAGELLSGLGEALAIRADPFQALPGSARGEFRQLRVVVARCGACGPEPAPADADYFSRIWLSAGRQAGSLLDPEADRLGFAMAADGEGRKTAVAVIGTRRPE